MLCAGVLLMLAAVNGDTLYSQRQFAAAEVQFRRTLAAHPADMRARLMLARTLIELGRVAEALAELERASKSPDPEIQFQAGQIARSLAERRFADLERVAPDSAAVKELAGRQYELLGKLSDALREYQSAIEREPSRPGLHYETGNILWRMRELDAAERELRAELTTTPHHGLANLRLGQLHLARDDAAGAAPLLAKAVQALPESAEARRELGKACRKLGRLAEARTLWEWVAKARPQDDQVHYLLGNLYRQLGEEALARRQLQEHRDLLARKATRE